MKSIQEKALPVTARVKLTLCTEDRFFGPGVCELLERIRETGSIQAAAARMELSYTKRHIILLAVLFVIGAASVAGYLVYDYNNKSFSADYTAAERLHKNTEMNAWVTEERPELKTEETVTIIESARSKVGSNEMTYELAIYRIDTEKYRVRHDEAEAAAAAGKEGAKPYTTDTLNGYSKSKAAKDDTLIRVGTGTAVTDKGTMKDNSIGDRISMEINMSWGEEEKP